MKKIPNIIKNSAISFFKRREVILLLVCLLIGGIFHAYNMFHYPYYENDEGVYMAQAWSFLSHGRLAPYTYWYDHAPLGWIFLSLWLLLSGGVFTFGFSINSGRVLMLLLHLASIFFLFKSTKKITNSNLAATIASLIFSLSPLAIYFQRRVLLDNIMIFWILFSLFLILFSRQKLWMFLLSSITFGIGVLSKENGIFILPVFLILVTTSAHKHNRLFATILWIVIAAMVITWYPLYALFKKELFPNGSILSPTYPHVSLLGSLASQADRGTGFPFWNFKSDFMTNFFYWYKNDFLFVLLSSCAFVFTGILGIFKKAARIIFFLTFSMLLFFISGKLVINFYIIALVPFLSMCIGICAYYLTAVLRKIHWSIHIVTGLAMMLSLFSYYYQNPLVHTALFHEDTMQQVIALNWIKKHVNPKTYITIDYSGNLDLSLSRFKGDPAFANADWYWKVEEDPAIRETKLHNNPRNIDYIMLSSQLYKDMQTFPQTNSILWPALGSSSPVAMFTPQNVKEFSLSTYPISHPNGDWIILYKQNSLGDDLRLSWDSYKKTYIKNGEVTDAYSLSASSEYQSQALLESVMNGDKKTYDELLSFTTSNMLLGSKYLFATSYSPKMLNSGTTTDADEAIAYSLLLASKKWQDTRYISLAKKIIADIYAYETISANGNQVLVAGDWAQNVKDTHIVNSSYITPVFYRAFAQVDPHDNWSNVLNSSYIVLTGCTNAFLDKKTSINIPPNWCSIATNGQFGTAPEIDPNSSDYSYAAVMVPYNISLDYLLFKDKRDLVYLKQLTFFQSEWTKNHKIYAGYYHDGVRIGTGESLTEYNSMLSYFSVINKNIANQIYDSKVAPYHTIVNNLNYWGDPKSSQQQNWFWLTIQTYSGNARELIY